LQNIVFVFVPAHIKILNNQQTVNMSVTPLLLLLLLLLLDMV
jgi:hypothetical protein